MEPLGRTALEAGLEEIRRSPSDDGSLELIVRRPAENEREVLAEGMLDSELGLVGDTWRKRGSSRTEDGSSHPDMQMTLMNSRVAALVAQRPDRRRLAGDQLFVDLDLSCENLPPGTRLAVGSAVLEITDEPHRGCGKFSSRFGVEALKFVNSKVGRELNMRGIYARVVVSGVVRQGDVIAKVPAALAV